MSRVGSDSLARIAKYRPAGPPPTQTIRIGDLSAVSRETPGQMGRVGREFLAVQQFPVRRRVGDHAPGVEVVPARGKADLVREQVVLRAADTAADVEDPVAAGGGPLADLVVEQLVGVVAVLPPGRGQV